jgi:hypothetical protein
LAGTAEQFVIDTITPDEVPYWYHVYSTIPHANSAGSLAQGYGDTRFAPVRQADGTHVDTYYAASSVKCALNESVLHDIPCGGLYRMARLQEEGRRMARIRFERELTVVSFHTNHLPLLALRRDLLIDTLADAYAQTRPWAEAAFRQCLSAEAISYGSRLNDAGRCVMLFGQRLVTSFTVVDDVDISTAHQVRSALIGLMKSQAISWV